MTIGKSGGFKNRLNCDFCDLVMAMIKGACAAIRRLLLLNLEELFAQLIGQRNLPEFGGVRRA